MLKRERDKASKRLAKKSKHREPAGQARLTLALKALTGKLSSISGGRSGHHTVSSQRMSGAKKTIRAKTCSDDRIGCWDNRKCQLANDFGLSVQEQPMHFQCVVVERRQPKGAGDGEGLWFSLAIGGAGTGLQGIPSGSRAGSPPSDTALTCCRAWGPEPRKISV